MDKGLIMDSKHQTNRAKKGRNWVQVGPRDLDPQGVDLDPNHELSGIVYPIDGGKGPGKGGWVQVGPGRTWTQNSHYSPKNKVFSAWVQGSKSFLIDFNIIKKIEEYIYIYIEKNKCAETWTLGQVFYIHNKEII